MLEAWPFALGVGTVLGFLSGLGVGGGSLLILWLSLVLGMEHTAARGINLAFFLPAAAVACFFRWRHGDVQKQIVIPSAIAGCAAAAVCSWIGLRMDLGMLKKLFGGLLILTGLRELFYRSKKH